MCNHIFSIEYAEYFIITNHEFFHEGFCNFKADLGIEYRVVRMFIYLLKTDSVYLFIRRWLITTNCVSLRVSSQFVSTGSNVPENRTVRRTVYLSAQLVFNMAYKLVGQIGKYQRG